MDIPDKLEELGSNSAQQLIKFVERIESLEAEKAQTAANIKAEKELAKAAGFEVKAINQMLKDRKADLAKTTRLRAVVQTYLRAVGQYADTELGQWALQFIREQAATKLESARAQFRGERAKTNDPLN